MELDGPLAAAIYQGEVCGSSHFQLLSGASPCLGSRGRRRHTCLDIWRPRIGSRVDSQFGCTSGHHEGTLSVTLKREL